MCFLCFFFFNFLKKLVCLLYICLFVFQKERERGLGLDWLWGASGRTWVWETCNHNILYECSVKNILAQYVISAPSLRDVFHPEFDIWVFTLCPVAVFNPWDPQETLQSMSIFKSFTLPNSQEAFLSCTVGDNSLALDLFKIVFLTPRSPTRLIVNDLGRSIVTSIQYSHFYFLIPWTAKLKMLFNRLSLVYQITRKFICNQTKNI